MRKRERRAHPCEWCGASQPAPVRCYPGCEPKRGRHGDGPAEDCPRGSACLRERDSHEGMARAAAAA
jgi:hypothetical protein